MDRLHGFVEKIVYRNKDNCYTVLTLVEDELETTCVGTFQYINEGEYIDVEGEYINHPTYGEQLAVSHYEIKEPEDLESIEKYLGSGAIKGIGVSLAGRIVRRFKNNTMKIIEEEPERLTEIKGISERIAMDIARQVNEKRDVTNAMIFMQKYGITPALSVKIYAEYGEQIYSIIEKNPYRLAQDINGVGFKIADEIARKVGISCDDEFRISCAVLYVLNLASMDGNVYVPMDILKKNTYEILQIDNIDIDKIVMDMIIDKRIILKEVSGEKRVYASTFYFTELNIARMLNDLNVDIATDEEKIRLNIQSICKEEEITLDENQTNAVLEAIKHGLLVITGGPGTGKTTIINIIIKYFQSKDYEIRLAAPTGRAAKRMSETTGFEASTIHRMLEMNPGKENDIGSMGFGRNESNPLEADVIIIDEMSMVDMFLMNSLLKAIVVGTRVILVGDAYQLPSVGPGNVLKDIIDSQRYTTSKLTKIFRQDNESDIVINAHRINAGESVSLDNKSKDFLFIDRDDANRVIGATLTLVKEKLPNYVNTDYSNVQVLTPMRKGLLGVERLNTVLQEYLNPKDDMKKEKEYGNGLFREGDRVMQVKNNYQMEWEVRNKYSIPIDAGTGIYNGDMGVIKIINQYAENMEIEFDDKRMVVYPFSKLDELELSYAVTIHKSQGSEYPAVVLPLLDGPSMLFNRNILYTAVTRAKNCVCIVGSKETVNKMIENKKEISRYSSLKEAINEL